MQATGSTLKCPKGPVRSLDGTRAPGGGGKAERYGDEGNTEDAHSAWVGCGHLDSTQDTP